MQDETHGRSTAQQEQQQGQMKDINNQYACGAYVIYSIAHTTSYTSNVRYYLHIVFTYRSNFTTSRCSPALFNKV
jgi:hypothetical protein